MITSKNRLSRRTVLRGAGVCTTLPFLSAMLKPGESYAQETAKRLVIFYTPGGVGNLHEEWKPGADMALSALTAPLEPFKQKLTFFEGVDLTVALEKGKHHPHNRGMAGVLTGTLLDGGTPATAWAQGPSLDQVVAKQIGTEATKFQSLEFAAGYGTGKSAVGGPHSASSINYSGRDVAVPPQQDPLAAFNRMFSDLEPGSGDDGAKETSLKVMDKVAAEYMKVAAVVPHEDRMRLEQHMDFVSQARASAAAGVDEGCVAPTTVNMTPGHYDPKPFDPSQLPGGNDGNSNINPFDGKEVPEKGRVMSDMLVAGLNCGITNVGTMQWGDSEAKFMLSFLNDPSTNEELRDHHHGYQHDRSPDGNPDVLRVIHNWYFENFAYLLKQMDDIAEPNGMTMLDNSLVLHVSELQYAPSHGQKDMPFILAGSAGGTVPTGRHLKATAGTPHNHLLTSLAKLYGVPGDSFGDADYAGTLAGLV